LPPSCIKYISFSALLQLSEAMAYRIGLMLIGCTAWFDINTTSPHMVDKSAKMIVLQTHTNLKSAANSLEHIAYSAGHCLLYSVSCGKVEKEIDLSQNGVQNKKGKNIDHQGPRTIPNICHFQTRLISCGLECTSILISYLDVRTKD
jgi:hypothetical protein